jgi:hypothetical protein
LTLLQFEWLVDLAGYTIKEVKTPTGPEVCLEARGGPPRFYRPLDNPGLWLRFATQCVDQAGALAFANEFGLLSAKPPLSGFELLERPVGNLGLREPPKPVASELVPIILGTAELIRRIAQHLDRGERATAADLFDRWAIPELTAGLKRGPGKFELEFVPRSLEGALLLQAAETITGNRQWRRCRNGGCHNWMQIGGGARTERAEFCSDKCRVQAAWRRKKGGHHA